MRVKIQQKGAAIGIPYANQLGTVAGLSPAVAAHVYNGSFSKIGIDTLSKLCRALQCPPNALMTYSGDK
jgi:DNA-binding Xre family transcriptional regulator